MARVPGVALWERAWTRLIRESGGLLYPTRVVGGEKAVRSLLDAASVASASATSDQQTSDQQ